VNSSNQPFPVTAFISQAPSRARELKNQIYISEAYDPSTGDTEPKRKEYVCIWDTGATNTVVTKKVVNDLGLIPTGKVKVQSVGQGALVNEFEVDTYVVNIFLPNKVGIIGVRVSEGTIGSVDVLIGMDIIAMGDFAITNQEGKTAWTFRMPSMGKIDFVAEINASKIKTPSQPLTPDEKRRERNRKKRKRRESR